MVSNVSVPRKKILPCETFYRRSLSFGLAAFRHRLQYILILSSAAIKTIFPGCNPIPWQTLSGLGKFLLHAVYIAIYIYIQRTLRRLFLPTTAGFLPIMLCAEHRSRSNISNLPCAIFCARRMSCVRSGFGTDGTHMCFLFFLPTISLHCKLFLQVFFSSFQS